MHTKTPINDACTTQYALPKRVVLERERKTACRKERREGMGTGRRGGEGKGGEEHG